MRYLVNRKWIIRSAMLAAICGTTAVLAAKKQVTPEEAIKRAYPDAQAKLVDTRQVNGVKVQDYTVTTSKGSSIAKVTEFGDIVQAGEPRGTADISGPAAATLSGLFKTGAQDVDSYRIASYVLEVSSGKKDFRLTFDPVGRLHDIVNEAELRAEQSQPLEKVDDKDKALKADDFAKKYNSDATVEAVYKSPVGDDFFLVDMKEKDGKDARITVNNAGRVFSYRDEIDQADVPKAVMDAFNDMFGTAKVNHTYRYEYEYYQVEKTTAGGYRCTIQIRPNGDIISVRSDSPEEKPAATPAKKPKKP